MIRLLLRLLLLLLCLLWSVAGCHLDRGRVPRRFIRWEQRNQLFQRLTNLRERRPGLYVAWVVVDDTYFHGNYKPVLVNKPMYRRYDHPHTYPRPLVPSIAATA